jgi:hypothetical protein
MPRELAMNPWRCGLEQQLTGLLSAAAPFYVEPVHEIGIDQSLS